MGPSNSGIQNKVGSIPTLVEFYTESLIKFSIAVHSPGITIAGHAPINATTLPTQENTVHPVGVFKFPTLYVYT